MEHQAFARQMVQFSREVRRKFLKISLLRVPTSDIVKLVNVILNPSIISDEHLRQELATDICENLDLQTLTPRGKKNLAQLLEALFFQALWDERFLLLDVYIDAFSDEIHKILGLACSVAAASCEFSETEQAKIANYLFQQAATDANKVCEAVAICEERHRNNRQAEKLLDALRSEIKVQGLQLIVGPEIRRQYFQEIVSAGRIDDNVLILGSSGTGKTTLAQILHSNSSRRGQNLQSYKCDQEKDRQRVVAETVENPVLGLSAIFLDEVHMLPTEIQYRLVTGLEERNVRVISASSKVLDELQGRGLLIPDFLRRYCEKTFQIPDLWKRPRDLRAFIIVEARKHSLDIDDQVVRDLVYYHRWPQNNSEVREIMQEICSVIQSQCQTIDRTVLRRNLGNFPERSQSILREIPAIL